MIDLIYNHYPSIDYMLGFSFVVLIGSLIAINRYRRKILVVKAEKTSLKAMISRLRNGAHANNLGSINFNEDDKVIHEWRHIPS